VKHLSLLAVLTCGAFLNIPGRTAYALEDGTRESIFVSPYTKHYNYNPAHRPVWLVGLEQQLSDNSLRGAAFFSNSFGQESLYLFPWGGRFDNTFGVNGLYVKWTAGFIYGYKAPYEDKVPFNHRGISPAVIPSVGYQVNNDWSAEAYLLGKAAFMLGTSYRFK
jgi:hypothetical protein